MNIFKNKKAQYGYAQPSQKNWIHIVGAVALVIVFFSNYLVTSDLGGSFITSILDFDSSLSTYIDSVLVDSTKDNILSIVVIIAHLYLYIWVFLVLLYYVFPMQGIFSNLIFTTLLIMLLHVINFTFIDNNPFTFASLKELVPYSGIWHLLTNFGALAENDKVIIEVIEKVNETNSTINVDLT